MPEYKHNITGSKACTSSLITTPLSLSRARLRGMFAHHTTLPHTNLVHGNIIYVEPHCVMDLPPVTPLGIVDLELKSITVPTPSDLYWHRHAAQRFQLSGESEEALVGPQYPGILHVLLLGRVN